MSQRHRALISTMLALLTVAGVGAAATGHRLAACELEAPVVASCRVVTVHGLVGSEKVAFFTDPRVVSRFRSHGLEVSVEPAGSRAMRCADPAHYDFAFPGSRWAAEAVERTAVARGLPARPVSTVLESPVVVVTFADVEKALTDRHVVVDRRFLLDRYLDDVVAHGVRWRDLGLTAPYPVQQRAVLMSTRLDTSNSAESYLVLAAAAAGRGRPLGQLDQGVHDRLVGLFRAEGSAGRTSEEPFAQYLSPDGYQLPMQVAYEQQFVGAAQHGTVPDTVVHPPDTGDEVRLARTMLYPTPSIVSRHTVAPLSAWGEEVAGALRDDPELRRLAAARGFRAPGHVSEFLDALGPAAPALHVLADVGPTVPDPPEVELSDLVSTVATEVYGQDAAHVCT